MSGDIEEQIENSQLKRSGLTIKKIMKIAIHSEKYDPTKNDDEYCFKNCAQCYSFMIYKNHNQPRKNVSL